MGNKNTKGKESNGPNPILKRKENEYLNWSNDFQKPLKAYKVNNLWVFFAFQLLDGRIAVGGNGFDFQIYIIGKESFENIVISIFNGDGISDLIQMPDGMLIAIGEQAVIIQIGETNYEIKQRVECNEPLGFSKIAHLSCGQVAISTLHKIKLFDYKEGKLSIKKEINLGNNVDGLTFFEYKPNEIAISCRQKLGESENKCIFNFYNTVKRKKIKSLPAENNISSRGQKFTNISDNFIVMADDKNIYVINVNNYTISQTLKINDDGIINCFLRLNDSILLAGNDKGTLYEYEIKEKEINLKNTFKQISQLETIEHISKYEGDKIILGGKKEDVYIF